MAIDWNKPLRTKERHLTARYLGSFRGSHSSRVCVIENARWDGYETVYCYDENGKNGVADLENVPELRPLNASEMANLVGNRIRRKGLDFTFMVISSGPDSVAIIENDMVRRVSAIKLMDEFEEPDGRPLSRLNVDMPF